MENSLLHYDAIIIGAGLAGLTAASELAAAYPEWKICLIEKERIGGQCFSTKHNGNFFDIGGHFFHNFDKLPAKYAAFLEKCVPFAKNTYAVDIRNRVYHGMIQNFFPLPARQQPDDSSLEKHYISRFGQELYDLFLGPYNQKLNVSPLKDCVPVSLINNRTPKKNTQSYNSHFVYPKTGGCNALIDYLWNDVKDKVTLFFDECADFDSSAKTVLLKSGTRLIYTKCLFTSTSVAAHLGMDAVSPCVFVYNGYGKTKPQFDYLSKDPNWTYLADPHIPVFRLGNYQICSAQPYREHIPFYLEANRPLESKDLNNFFESYQLVSVFQVKNAYPVLTKGYQDKIRLYIEKCKEKNIFWIGRYGQDKWLSMAETISDTLATLQLVQEQIVCAQK